MLQLKHKKGEYEITDRTNTVQLAERHLTLGDQRISEPGEYEVNTIEVVYGTVAALLIWEHLQIAYLFSLEGAGEFEKDQFSSSDVLIVGDDLPELSKNSFDELLGIYDPKVIVISAQANLEAGLKASLKFTESPTAKLAKANLPEEGRDFYLVS